nr:ABC transporter ATP-binding protein [Robinsoniella peoriensis]
MKNLFAAIVKAGLEYGIGIEMVNKMENIAISLRNVCRDFGEEKVLKNITHDFECGMVHGIVGMNGSGKTVLLKCICGFLFPTKGRIYVEGKLVGRDIDFPESLGMIIESPGFLPNLSGFKNLKLLASLRGEIDDETIRSAIRRVGLDAESKKHVGKYSMGMRERLGIAQAIMEDPDILILDEPFNGLDKRGVQEVYDLMLELNDQGKTIFLVSHNAADIEMLCDTVCEMDAGELKVLVS